jgi:hypothetical protein
MRLNGTMKGGPVIVLLGITALAATPALSAEWKVLEIDCGSKPLTGDKKCAKDRIVGSELEIIVNPTTQKVL